MMQFKNAQTGIKRIITSQKFAILSAIANGVSVLLLAMIRLKGGSVDNTFFVIGFTCLLFGIVTVVATVLMMIFGFIGYTQASKDEADFKKAMICILVSGALSIIGFFFQLPNGAISTILSTAGTIVEMFVIIFSMSALINLSDNCERQDMNDRGNTLLNLMVITYFIAAINALMIRVFELSSRSRIVSTVVGGIDIALNIFQYIIYMRYLYAVRKMLEEYHSAEVKGAADE